jgi:phospholipase/carboxylesterase
MNLKKLNHLVFVVLALSALVACQNKQNITVGDKRLDDDDTVISDEPTADSDESLAVPPANSTSMPDSIAFPLPERSGPRIQTSGTVPHVQIGVEPVKTVNDELFRRAFALPGVEDRPTIVSLPGARGMWLKDDIALANPQAIVAGREFAHIHTDGSLHAPLPYERALEIAEKGWGERHPWADEREGWDGLVMLFTPQSMEELDITFQLIVESYNFVTGQTVQASDFE